MEGLGIDPKILIGDIVTFIVLLALLKKYAYKPFLTVLEQRRVKIEEGVTKSDEAEKSLQKIRGLAEEVKAASERKSKELILAAEQKANEKARVILSAADAERIKMIEAAKQSIAAEGAREKEHQQKEAVDLAFSLAEKFIGQTLTKEQDKKLIERCAQGLK